MRINSKAQFLQDLGVSNGNTEQRPGGTCGRATTLLPLRQEGRGEIVEFGFLVNDQEPDGFGVRVELDGPGAAAFSLSRRCPTDLTAAATSPDDITDFWIGRDPVDELNTLDFRPDFAGVALEDSGFSNCSHPRNVRQ